MRLPAPPRLKAIKIIPSKFGAERNKVIFLIVCLLVAAYFYFTSGSGEQPSSPSAKVKPAVANNSSPARNARGPVRDISRSPGGFRGGERTGSNEFRPSLKPKKGADAVNPITVDPTLRIDLLRRVQQVALQGSERSLFEFSQGPVAIAKTIEKPIIPTQKPFGPIPAPKVGEGGDAAKPPATPIPLKFYGFTKAVRQGPKTAFFLDGEDIVIAGEGEVIKRRYKIIRIGVNSAVVEDVEQKNQQTLPLVEELAG